MRPFGIRSRMCAVRNAATVALFPLSLAGCLAALDFDGITGGPPADGGGLVSDGGTNGAMPVHPDAGDGAPEDAASPFDAPPICDELTMLMRFDGSLTSAQGSRQPPFSSPDTRPESTARGCSSTRAPRGRRPAA
jgi:hypothetical protein